MFFKNNPLSKIINSTLSGLLLSGFLFLPKAVQAQVGVSPMVIEAEAKQGQATGVITLSNSGEQEAQFRLYAQPFTYNQNGLEVLESSENDLAPYLVFSPAEVTVQPGQTRRIRLVARFLPSTPAGEYRSVIFAEPLIERTEQSGMVVNSRIGVTVYVRHGETSPNMSVSSATYDSEKGVVNLLVSNSGNATARPRVTWRLLQGNQQIANNEISEITIIAEGERNINLRLTESDPALTAGTYEITGELTWGDFMDPQTLPFDVDLIIP